MLLLFSVGSVGSVLTLHLFAGVLFAAAATPTLAAAFHVRLTLPYFRHMFEVEQVDYDKEQIDWSYITFNDNKVTRFDSTRLDPYSRFICLGSIHRS